MRIFAHRGFHKRAPENTLEAFRQAKEVGVDGIETDVRPDRNGVPILFHDRRTKDGQLVSSLALSDLRAVTKLAVPTLEEALCDIESLTWNIEIKDPRVTDSVIQLLRRFADSRQIMVTSFFHGVVVQCVANTAADGGLLISHRPLNPRALFESPPLSSKIKALVWDFETIDPDLLVSVREAGKVNIVYGFLKPEDHVFRGADSVDTIITDFPDHALRAKKPSREGTHS